MAFLSLFFSMLIFGTDDLLIFQSKAVVLITGDDVFWRYLLAFAFAAIAMTTVAALSFMLSLFAENSIGPIVATMSVVIVFTILTTMDLPLFLALKPYLFTSHMLGWKGFFDVQQTADNAAVIGSIHALSSIIRSAVILLVHIVLFVSVTIFLFRRKDVLS